VVGVVVAVVVMVEEVAMLVVVDLTPEGGGAGGGDDLGEPPLEGLQVLASHLLQARHPPLLLTPPLL